MTAPAQRLRDAARGMREKAEAARSGTWQAKNETVTAIWQSGPREVAVCSGSLPEGNALNAAYIAAMSPNVAVAVADLLDMTADLLPPDPHGEDEDCCCCRHARDALAVADAFLGVEHE